MNLEALSNFNLVAAHGGFGRASRVTGRPKATLSRRVAELELSLGVRLIERGSKSLRLTDEGRALHERTDGLLSEIVEAGEAVVLGASTPRGRLRVSAPIDMKRPIPTTDGAVCPVRAVLLSAAPSTVVWRMSSRTAPESVLEPEPVIRFSSLLLVRDAVLAGAGAALLPKLLVADDVEAGRLACWGTHTGPSVEI